MTSLKFYKGAFGTGTEYVDGGIYFDNTSHEIRVGKGAVDSYDAFGSHINDVTLSDNVLTFSFFNKANIAIDLSDCASAEAVANALSVLEGRVASLENVVGAEASEAVYFEDYAEYLAAMQAAGHEYVSESSFNALPADDDEKIKVAAVAASGLIGDVAELKAALGDGEGISARLDDVEDLAEETSDKVTNLENIVGSQASEGVSHPATEEEVSEGLAENVGDPIWDVEPVDATGLVKDVADNAAAIAELQDAGYITSNDVLVDGIASGDSILTLSGKKIGTVLTMSYGAHDDGKNYIDLKGKDDEIISSVDATPFIVDGVLESASLTVIVDGKEGDEDSELEDGKYFKFVWSGVDKEPVYVPMSDFAVESYTAGDDISLADGVFSVATSDDVTIAGGPLANNVLESGDTWPWQNADGANIIPAGMNLTDILTGLFLKVINGTVNEPVYTWNPSLAQPSAVINGGQKQEVGAETTVTFAASQTVSGNTTTATVTTTQGYFTDVNGTWNSGNYSISVAGGTIGTAVATATFNDDSVNSNDTVTIKEGTNTLAVNSAGLSASSSDFPIGPGLNVFASTNTKKVIEDSYVFVEGAPFSSAKALTSSKSVSITGYYPIYTNGTTSATDNLTAPEVTKATNDSYKLPLVADNTLFGVAFDRMIPDGEGYRILIQKDKVITYAYALNGSTAKYDIDIKNNFIKDDSEVVEKPSGAGVAEYYVWEYKGREGANRVNFKID